MKRRDFVRFAGLGIATIGATPLLATAGGRDNFVISDIREVSKKMVDEIFKSNAFYKKTKSKSFFESFVATQHPRVTLVGCSDSRFQIAAVDDTPENDIFVVRNIGNQFGSNPGSVEYGVRHLHTPLLIFMGHSRCGAIKAAMSDYSKESMLIKKEIDSLSISIKKAKDGYSENEKWLNAVVSNVHQQVCNARAEFEAEVKSGKLTIVGMVYDFANDFKEGYGALKIVNVNGESDMGKIREMPIFRSVIS
jgi:carbonic anhydrase